MNEDAQKFLVFIGVIAIVAASIWAIVYQNQQWQQYATQHHCGGWTADQTIYHCDNGEEQIR